MMMYDPPHPGEILKESFIEELGLGINELARMLDVYPSTVQRLASGQADISPEMALRLSKVLHGSPEFWMGLQQEYSLWRASQKLDVSRLQPLVIDKNKGKSTTQQANH